MATDLQDKEAQELYNELFVLQKNLEDFWRSIPIPLCSTNPVLNILEIGESFKNTFGYTEEEIIGENLDKLFLNKEEFEELKKRLFEKGGLEKEEAELLPRSGKEIVSSIYAKPKRDKKGALVGYIFSFLNITERKMIERELEGKVKELQKFAADLKDSRVALLNILEDVEEAQGLAETERDKTLAIVNNFPEGLLFFDKASILASVNPKIQDLFGSLSLELAGKSFSQVLENSVLSPLGKVFENAQLVEVSKKELSLKDDLILEVSSINVMRKKEKAGTLVILRDITREKIIEKLKTEFVSIAAHQLRTPLSAVKWTLRMILDGDLGQISDEQKTFLERTYKSNERMIRLINDLLNVTRIEEGRFLYKSGNEDIIELIERTISSLGDAIQRRKIHFVFAEGKQKIPRLEIDTEKICLVLQNLLDNALHYTQAGGKVELSVDYLQAQDEVLISVADTGLGIPQKQQDRVFTRFFRGTNAIRAETEGTGLGLYIAKNIIEAHNGRIWFQSEEGKGTTFYFTLPTKKEFKEFIRKF